MVFGWGKKKSEQQETDIVAEIARETIERGYVFTGRLHCSLWGNRVGV